MGTYNPWPVSQVVIAAIKERLSDDTYGLNATYNGLASFYGVPADLDIDWTGSDNSTGKSRNFALANVSAQQWESTGAFEFPLITLFTDGGDNMNLQKFHLFAGPVEVGMNIFLSWKQARLKLAVFEPMAWCMEDAVTQVFNRARNAFPGDQDWGVQVVYNGNIGWKKSRIEEANEFWGQLIAFRFQFEVIQRGDT
jgi:hypothetical protein